MKISTSLDHAIKIDKATSRESARIMKKVGFEGIDLALCHDMNDPAKILAPHWADRVFADADAARAEGLEIAQCHLPYECPQDTVEEYAAVWTEAMLHSLKIAYEAGAKTAVIHPITTIGDPEATHKGNVEFFRLFVPYLEKYEHPLWVGYHPGAEGHGGIDSLQFDDLFRALEAGEKEMPIDVYDMATWMAITVLSEQSMATGTAIPFPDFTDGKWIYRENKFAR